MSMAKRMENLLLDAGLVNAKVSCISRVIEGVKLNLH